LPGDIIRDGVVDAGPLQQFAIDLERREAG
jgi:hypothetical protein